MGSIRRRDVAIRTAAMAMLEEGKVLSKKEFDMITKPTGVRSGNLMNLFGSWSRLVGFIEKDHPDIWAQLKGEPTPVEKEHANKCPCDSCECDPCECIEEKPSEPDPLAALAKASEVKEDDE
tara:strand:+ start:570 stop:935 length:366 start_codon:yes stop_codon:yes gene_type:complete